MRRILLFLDIIILSLGFVVLIEPICSLVYNSAGGIKDEIGNVSSFENLRIKQVDDNKYVFKSLSNDVIEIGSERHSPPMPYLKINKWDGEVSMKVNVPYVREDYPTETKDNKLVWSDDDYDVKFYPKEPEEIKLLGPDGKDRTFTINDGGGVEVDLVLKEKSASNVFTFPIQTKGLKFYYQPELTQQEIDKGAFRPENVVGSYAVYHESKQGNYEALGGKNYRAGKAFHIYRPKVRDTDGNEIWGELNIDERQGILTITVNQK